MWGMRRRGPICYNTYAMKHEFTSAVASVAVALVSMVALAEYRYIISDESVNESKSDWSDGFAPVSGVNSGSAEAGVAVDARFRTWGYSEGVGIDPTLTRGFYILIR